MLADGDNRRDCPLDGDKMPAEYLSVESFFDGFASRDDPATMFGDPMQLFDDSLITLNTDHERFAKPEEQRRAQSFPNLPDLTSSAMTNDVLDPILAEASIPLSLDCYVPSQDDSNKQRRGPKRRRSAPATTASPNAPTTTSAFMSSTKRGKGPGSPRGRPRSLYKPGEKPVPPNIYNVITSPAMSHLKPSPLSPTMHASPVLMSPMGDVSMAPQAHPPNAMHQHTTLPQGGNFFPSQWPGPAPLMPAANGAGYWGFHPYHPAYLAAINNAPRPSNYYQSSYSSSSSYVPKVPITAGPAAESDMKAGFLRLDSPTSSLTSAASPEDPRRGGPVDTAADGATMIRQTHALKQQFLSATRNLDRDSVTVLEMKQILRRFSLPCNGKKDDLIGRIAGIRQDLMGGTDILI